MTNIHGRTADRTDCNVSIWDQRLDQGTFAAADLAKETQMNRTAFLARSKLLQFRLGLLDANTCFFRLAQPLLYVGLPQWLGR